MRHRLRCNISGFCERGLTRLAPSLDFGWAFLNNPRSRFIMAD